MKKILIVDDDLTHQKFLSRFLSKQFEVSECLNKDQFDDLISKDKYDLIVMDLKLEGENDGVSLTKKLKKKKDYKEVPIVVLTGRTDPHVKEDCIKAGISEYIVKPIDYSELLAILNERIKK